MEQSGWGKIAKLVPQQKPRQERIPGKVPDCEVVEDNNKPVGGDVKWVGSVFVKSVEWAASAEEEEEAATRMRDKKATTFISTKLGV